MFKVDRIELREIGLSLKEPFRISSGSVTQRRILLVQVVDTEGFTGWGECVAEEAPNYSSETVDLSWEVIPRWVAPRILGKALAGPEAIFSLLEIDFRGHRMSKAAVEMATWDLHAKRLGEPLARLLGGTRKKIPVGISVGIQDSPTRLAEKVEAALAQGYRKIKLKIRPRKDVDYVGAAHQAAGGGSRLMVDANNAYSPQRIEPLLELDRLGLMMIEQPLAWDDLLRHAELQKRLQTPICLDESITSVERAQDMFRLGSGKIVNIKPGRVGGFQSSRQIHDFCQRRSIPVWCGGMLESGIGRAHNVALASLPNFSLPGDLSPSSRYWERDIVTPEWTMNAEGQVTVPWHEPGIGVEVDLDRVDDLTRRRLVLDSPGGV